MLKIFRKIRLKLLGENRVGKYLLYAGGEILLIIIGVLIALSVAEWNGNRKDQAKEKTFLKEINAGLNKSQAELESKIQATHQAIKKISTLDSLLDDKTFSYHDSLDTLFGAVFGLRLFSLEKSSFDDLKAEGLNLVSSDSIRRQLIVVFEKADQSLKTMDEIEFKINDIVRPYFFENFHDLQFWTTASPNDFQAVWNDTYFQNLVDYRLIALKLNQRDLYSQYNGEIETLKTLIEEYLSRSREANTR